MSDADLQALCSVNLLDEASVRAAVEALERTEAPDTLQQSRRMRMLFGLYEALTGWNVTSEKLSQMSSFSGDYESMGEWAFTIQLKFCLISHDTKSIKNIKNRLFRRGVDICGVCDAEDLRKKFIEEVPQECSICFEEIRHGENILELICNHCFHPACLWKNIKLNRSGQHRCPMCRNVLHKDAPEALKNKRQRLAEDYVRAEEFRINR